MIFLQVFFRKLISLNSSNNRQIAFICSNSPQLDIMHYGLYVFVYVRVRGFKSNVSVCLIVKKPDVYLKMFGDHTDIVVTRSAIFIT